MNTENEKLLVRLDADRNGELNVGQNVNQEKISSRRTFLQRSALAGAVGATALGSLLSFASPTASAKISAARAGKEEEHDHLPKRDNDILMAAEIAEALAVTTYMNIIETSPFFANIPSDDQGYLEGALQEEMSHYALEKSVTAFRLRSRLSSIRKTCSKTRRRP